MGYGKNSTWEAIQEEERQRQQSVAPDAGMSVDPALAQSQAPDPVPDVPADVDTGMTVDPHAGEGITAAPQQPSGGGWISLGQQQQQAAPQQQQPAIVVPRFTRGTPGHMVPGHTDPTVSSIQARSGVDMTEPRQYMDRAQGYQDAAAGFQIAAQEKQQQAQRQYLADRSRVTRQVNAEQDRREQANIERRRKLDEDVRRVMAQGPRQQVVSGILAGLASSLMALGGGRDPQAALRQYQSRIDADFKRRLAVAKKKKASGLQDMSDENAMMIRNRDYQMSLIDQKLQDYSLRAKTDLAKAKIMQARAAIAQQRAGIEADLAKAEQPQEVRTQQFRYVAPRYVGGSRPRLANPVEVYMSARARGASDKDARKLLADVGADKRTAAAAAIIGAKNFGKQEKQRPVNPQNVVTADKFVPIDQYGTGAVYGSTAQATKAAEATTMVNALKAQLVGIKNLYKTHNVAGRNLSPKVQAAIKARIALAKSYARKISGAGAALMGEELQDMKDLIADPGGMFTADRIDGVMGMVDQWKRSVPRWYQGTLAKRTAVATPQGSVWKIDIMPHAPAPTSTGRGFATYGAPRK